MEYDKYNNGEYVVDCLYLYIAYYLLLLQYNNECGAIYSVIDKPL